MGKKRVILKDEDKVALLEANNQILSLQVNLRGLIIQEKQLQDALNTLINSLAKKYERGDGYILNSIYEFVKLEVKQNGVG